MKAKIVFICLVMVIAGNVLAQEVVNDIIQVNYEKKSARKAMLLSGIFPGAGQLYADKSSFTTYLFPVLEVGFWAGMIYYKNAGNDQEEDFKDFADAHYDRGSYEDVRDDLVGVYGDDNDYGSANFPVFYGYYNEQSDEGLFRLDTDNTQHYYEDIGKYDKYIFGWNDWYAIYATDEAGNEVEPNWAWEDATADHRKWIDMSNPNNPNDPDYQANQAVYDQNNGLYTSYRAEYIEMRNESKDLHTMSRNFSFALAINHIAAALDAVRVTRSRNLQYISSNHLKVNIVPTMVNNQISATLQISKRF